MQNFSQTPIPCDVADWFATPCYTNDSASGGKDITIPQALGNAKGYITLPTQHYFAHCGYTAKTNYDNFGLVMGSAAVAAAVITRPTVPNTFELEMQRSADNNYSNVRLTQAEVCSSGSLSGKQNPIPTIYGPGITIGFTFYDLTGFLRLTQADAAVPLVIQLWMVGYLIPESLDGVPDSNFRRFLKYFPALEAVYAR